jgi:heme oxygenase (biliverdin-producing, ferredoxin)
MSLRDLTHEAHKNAETKPFVKILFSGNIDPKLYATFLKNQHPCYDLLEACAMIAGLLNGLTDIRRSPKINADFLELWKEEQEPVILPVVKRYMDHIMSIKDDPKRLMAHVYVRHMGDLAGGQMIAKRVPGSGTMYQFEDPEGLKTAIRERISDDMAEEAIICFGFAAEMFEEMMSLVDE